VGDLVSPNGDLPLHDYLEFTLLPYKPVIVIFQEFFKKEEIGNALFLPGFKGYTLRNSPYEG
jgi:hypothetical protein